MLGAAAVCMFERRTHTKDWSGCFQGLAAIYQPPGDSRLATAPKPDVCLERRWCAVETQSNANANNTASTTRVEY